MSGRRSVPELVPEAVQHECCQHQTRKPDLGGLTTTHNPQLVSQGASQEYNLRP